MKKNCTKYLITARGNMKGDRQRVVHSFGSKSQAQKQLKKILSKPKGNQTAYRDAQSGIGLNNPRIKKMRGYC